MLRLFAKRWQRELASDIVEVPSDQDSVSDPDDNLYLHLNCGMQKREFLESEMGERKSKMGG